ncbi:MAG: FAD-binding protein, partial [Chlamydiae bacterium]|nr:FAD-binding protein [Chlamydiota bacterium]
MSVVRKDVVLRDYSTFGIGGAARYFIELRTVQDVVEALAFCRKEGLPFLVLGKGSNTLFDDRGYPGVVLLNKLQEITWREASFTVGSGYSFSLLGAQTAK